MNSRKNLKREDNSEKKQVDTGWQRRKKRNDDRRSSIEKMQVRELVRRRGRVCRRS